MTNFVFHPEAEAELLAAARYYEEQAENLGLDFLSAVQSSCDRIQRFPQVGHAFGAHRRRVLVARFPYGVIYRADEGRVFIVAVANLHRRPGYWRERT